MNYKKIAFLSVFMGLLILPILSVSAAPNPIVADTSLQDIIDAGKIVVGCEAGYPPFETLNPVTNEMEGFDPEIMQIIADDIGVDIEWKNVAWATIFTSLASGMFDCVISAVTITAERENTMDFSRWYFKSEQAVMVSTENPKSISTIDDVNATGIKVGVQEGTTSDLYLMDNNYTSTKSSYAAVTLAIEALKQGKVDVVLGDYATLVAGNTANDNIFTIVDTFSPEDFGIPVQTGMDSLRLRINTVLDGLLGENLTDPIPTKKYNDIYKKWMDVDAIGYEGSGSFIPGYPMLLVSMMALASVALILKKKSMK
ncbi:MAG: transporter substrate-binding domain-containing protein [Promethearchaeota archaeon]